MGIGLVMQGILSAAYHTCPSYNNFQIGETINFSKIMILFMNLLKDTSFMYIIGVINTIKLYQCRHPDIHPSSQRVFLFLAFTILLNVLGVVSMLTDATIYKNQI